MEKANNEPWREALKFINRCPICNTAYDAAKVSLFAEKQDARLVHMSCGKCRGGFIAMILVMGQGISSVGMVTDLTLADAKRLYNNAPLTLDEVLDAYEHIKINNIFFLN